MRSLSTSSGMSAIGTKRTSACALHMSAFDPKRTREAFNARSSLGKPMSFEAPAGRSAATNCDVALGVEAAEHERQFREILEFSPAALMVVDEDGRLLFHNARLRELLAYGKDELDRIDTRKFWHDLEQRSQIIASLRDRGGQLLNEKVVWRTKNGQLLDLLLTYAPGGLSRWPH